MLPMPFVSIRCDRIKTANQSQEECQSLLVHMLQVALADITYLPWLLVYVGIAASSPGVRCLGGRAGAQPRGKEKDL
ncbi:hypothetical protein SRHO_G00046200 [Serrasalmus rhombeus]